MSASQDKAADVVVDAGRYVVRPAVTADRDGWLAMWAEYCIHFHAPSPDAPGRLWQQLLNGDPNIGNVLLCRVADGRVVGFAHYVFHQLTWTTKRALRFQALFVTVAERGRAGGEMLLRAVIDAARERGCAYAHLLTRENNQAARRLFDRFAEAQPSLLYKWQTDAEPDNK